MPIGGRLPKVFIAAGAAIAIVIIAVVAMIWKSQPSAFQPRSTAQTPAEDAAAKAAARAMTFTQPAEPRQ